MLIGTGVILLFCAVQTASLGLLAQCPDETVFPSGGQLIHTDGESECLRLVGEYCNVFCPSSGDSKPVYCDESFTWDNTDPCFGSDTATTPPYASPFRLYVTDANRDVYSIDETGAVAQEFGFDDAYAIAIDPLMSKTELPELVYGLTTLHRRSIMGGADELVLNVTDYGGPYAVRLALDPTSGNLFYSSAYDYASVECNISVVSPAGDHKTLLTEYEGVRDIVIHPQHGLLFFISVNGKVPAWIGMAFMDGSSVNGVDHKLWESEELVSPFGLAIDYLNNRLYWSDSVRNIIGSCKYDEPCSETFVTFMETTVDAYDILIDGEFLYYNNMENSDITKVRLSDPNDQTTYTIPTTARLNAMTVYSVNVLQLLDFPNMDCNGRQGLGNCSNLCLRGSEGPVCKCGDGVNLLPNQMTCENAVLCDEIISEDVVLDPSCKYHEYEECGYMCMSDSEPQFPIPTVKCEKGGIWNGSISCGVFTTTAMTIPMLETGECALNWTIADDYGGIMGFVSAIIENDMVINRNATINVTVFNFESDYEWFGFGISNNEFMMNSDMIMAFKNGETWNISDRFAYTNAEPTVDAHKDIYDETIGTIDGTTYTLLYHRPVNTGDDQDLELDNNKHFLFARGTYSGGVLGQHYFSKATHVVSLACQSKQGTPTTSMPTTDLCPADFVSGGTLMSHTSNSCFRQKNEECYVTCDDGNMKDLYCTEAGVWDIQDPCSTFRIYVTSQADRAIYVLDEIGMNIETIDGPSIIWGIAMDYFTLESEPANHSVVFSVDQTEVFRKFVGSQPYTTGNQLFSAIDHRATIARIAVDPNSGFIYYTGFIPSADNTSYIGVYRKDGSQGQLVTDLMTPWDIVLNPEEGMIFWSDVGMDVISTAGMDGSGVIEIVTETQALALAIDLQDSLLYWADVDNFEINTYALDGSSVITTFTVLPEVTINDITIHGRLLYYTSANSNTVNTISLDQEQYAPLALAKRQAEITSFTVDSASSLNAIAIYNSSSAQTQPSVCPVGYFVNATEVSGCSPCPIGTYQDVPSLSTSCLPCPTGYNTATVGATSPAYCTIDLSIQCPETFASGGQLISTLSLSCNRQPYELCEVECTPEITHPVTCFPNGTWSEADPCSEPANLCPQTFESDGILTSTNGEATCDGYPGDTCSVQCLSQVVHNVYCHPNGTWNRTDPCGVSDKNPDFRILATTTQGNKIYSFNEAGQLVDTFNSANNLPVYGLAVDYFMPMSSPGPHNRSFVYSISLQGQAGFFRQYFNGTVPMFIALVGNALAERIAIDAGTGNVYYTGIYAVPENPEYPGFVGLVTPAGDQMIVRDNLIQPKDIVLYGLEGLMYWSDLGDSAIYKAYMNGTGMEAIVQGVQVYGLALDHAEYRLYWIEVEFLEGEMESGVMSLDLHDETFMTTQKRYFGEFLSDILIDGKFWYHTNADAPDINKVNTSVIEDEIIFSTVSGISNLDAIAVYSMESSAAPRSFVCEPRDGLGDCSTICLPSSATTRSCHCPESDVLLEDGKTCENAPLCPDSIEGGTFADPENCSFFKLDMCNVICDSSPATTTTIQCKEDGSWDNLCSVSCPAGQHANITEVSGCSLCPLGSYKSMAGSSPCEICSEGYSTPDLGSTYIAECTEECSPGTYWDDGACITCQVGSVQPLSAKLKCDECSDGTEPNNVTVPTACVTRCPPAFHSGGVLSHPSKEACDRNAYEDCEVTCPSGVLHPVFCNPNGTWNSQDPCLVSNPDLRILATSHASVFSFNEFGEVVDVFDSQDNLRIRGIALDHYIPMSNSGSHSPSFVYSVERDGAAEFYRQFLNMSGPVYIASVPHTRVERIAIDAGSGNIYYTGVNLEPLNVETPGYIGVLTPFGDHLIVVEGLVKPMDIVLHGSEGRVFWSDIGTLMIAYSYMNGDGFDIIATELEAYGLALDYLDDILYWVEVAFSDDAPMSTVKSYNIHEGSAIGIVKWYQGFLRDILIDGYYWYHLRNDTSKIDKVSKLATENEDAFTTGNDVPYLDAMAVYSGDSASVPRSYMCENRDGLGDCSTICLPSSSYDHTCHCPDGEEILNDEKTCANAVQCKTSIRGGVFESPASCSFFKLSVCEVLCDGARNTVSIQCTKEGEWDNPCAEPTSSTSTSTSTETPSASPTPSEPTGPTGPTGPTPSEPTGPTPSDSTGPTPDSTGPTPDSTGPTPNSTGPTPSEPTGPTPSEPTGPTPSDPTGPTPSDSTGPTPSEPTGPTPSEPTGSTAGQGTASTGSQVTGSTGGQGTGSPGNQGSGNYAAMTTAKGVTTTLVLFIISLMNLLF